MTRHDILAFAVAGEAVRQIRRGEAVWSSVLSSNVYATSSRQWPLPDFVILDADNAVSVAGEFKPPDQTKREYLTGLGQAVAYTRDFNYALLVIPDISDDGYDIAGHIEAVMLQHVTDTLPVGLLKYDAKALSTNNPTFQIRRALLPREGAFQPRASIDSSFYAKWRDMSPMEMGMFLELLYEEGRIGGQNTTIRDRAFDRFYDKVQAGEAINWSGGVRTIAQSNKVAWSKNYRNFMTHIGWCWPDGKLTKEGLETLQIVHQYTTESQIFLDHLASSLLTTGKHLVFINTINEFQDRRYREQGAFESEDEWLNEVEDYLELLGLLRRNPERHEAAVQGRAREFLKAEKTLWKNLGFLVRRGALGGRVYNTGRGFIFDWTRITALLAQGN